MFLNEKEFGERKIIHKPCENHDWQDNRKRRNAKNHDKKLLSISFNLEKEKG